MTLELVQQTSPWRTALDARRSKGDQIGIVLTMGSLHAGHMSLIRRAAAECDVVAVTDYVNPLQFGPAEDLTAYPRDLERDCELAEQAGAAMLFAPDTEKLWPEPPATAVTVEGLSEHLEGEHRPGHFQGVATVVAKLLSLTGPGAAYFGEKDFQQLLVIRKLVTDLSIPVRVIACPTVRDPDGLALSSRNAYLSEAERRAAPKLYYALLAGKRAIEEGGLTNPKAVEETMVRALAAEPSFTLDYAAVADPDDLSRPDCIGEEVRLLAAARLGRARLIDNVDAVPPEPPKSSAKPERQDRPGTTSEAGGTH